MTSCWSAKERISMSRSLRQSLHFHILPGLWVLLKWWSSLFGRNAVSAVKISSRTAATMNARVVRTAANKQDTITQYCPFAMMSATSQTYPDACYAWICWAFLSTFASVMYNQIHLPAQLFATCAVVSVGDYDRWLDWSAHGYSWQDDGEYAK